MSEPSLLDAPLPPRAEEDVEFKLFLTSKVLSRGDSDYLKEYNPDKSEDLRRMKTMRPSTLFEDDVPDSAFTDICSAVDALGWAIRSRWAKLSKEGHGRLRIHRAMHETWEEMARAIHHGTTSSKEFSSLDQEWEGLLRAYEDPVSVTVADTDPDFRKWISA